MIPMLLFFSIEVVYGHYCDTPECPEFSLVKSLEVKEVSSDSVELFWEPRENYTVEKYELQWFSLSGFSENVEEVPMLLNTSVRVSVKPCTLYTFELYGFHENFTRRAPAIVHQITAPNSLINGTAVRIENTWAIVRWLQLAICPESTHIAVCYGPNIIVQLKPFHTDDVVIFNISSLNANSGYVCNAYTFNSAGSSSPSLPVMFKTYSGIFSKKNISYENVFTALAICLVFLVSTLPLLFLLNKKGIVTLPRRRSYTVNETRL